MPNYDLIEGIRLALAKGYSLEQAMMSFYNAGYPREEIEEAARVLIYHPSIPLSHPEKQIPEELKKPVKAIPPSEFLIKPSLELEKQIISKYGEESKTKNKVAIGVLIFLLFILFAALAGIVLFKTELINFFANLFQ